jgi:hypothetical protein
MKYPGELPGRGPRRLAGFPSSSQTGPRVMTLLLTTQHERCTMSALARAPHSYTTS